MCNTVNETQGARLSGHSFSKAIVCSLFPSYACQRQDGSGCVYPETCRKGDQEPAFHPGRALLMRAEPKVSIMC